MDPNARYFDWNSLDLTALPFRVTKTNVFSAPQIDITTADPTRADGIIQLYRKIKHREITLEGLIRTDSAMAADTARDLLLKRLYYMRGKGALTFAASGMKRTFTGGIMNVIVPREGQDISRMAYSFQMMTDNAYATDDAGLIQFASPTVISSPYASIATQNDGTYLAAPVITLQVTSVPSGSALSTFSIRNPQTNESLTFTTTVENGDTITIDCDKLQTFRNSTRLDPTGTYPEWLPEGGLIEYSDSLATRSISLSANYMRKWF